MQAVKTTRLIVGNPASICSGSTVKVVATGSGRYQVESLSGVRLWCDADALEALPTKQPSPESKGPQNGTGR